MVAPMQFPRRATLTNAARPATTNFPKKTPHPVNLGKLRGV